MKAVVRIIFLYIPAIRLIALAGNLFGAKMARKPKNYLVIESNNIWAVRD